VFAKCPGKYELRDGSHEVAATPVRSCTNLELAQRGTGNRASPGRLPVYRALRAGMRFASNERNVDPSGEHGSGGSGGLGRGGGVLE
jgi:hypothetical protein